MTGYRTSGDVMIPGLVEETLRFEDEVNEVICVTGFARSFNFEKKKKDDLASGLFIKIVISLCFTVT